MIDTPAPRLLVVDDDEDLRRTLVDLLGDQGFECLEASDGAQAAEILHGDDPPDLILLDLRMPVMDGPGFLRWREGQAGLAEVPVVLLSAMKEGEAPPDSDHFLLRKPLDFGRLMRVIGRVLGGSSEPGAEPDGVAPGASSGSDPASHPTPDADLVARIASGENDALARLVERYGRELHGYLRRRLPDGDAEDVVQEVFVQVWAEAGRYRRSRGSPRTWLYTIARSRTFDRLRSERSRSRREKEAADGLIPSGRGEPEGPRRLEERQRWTLVLRLLRALPDAQRACVELAYFEGLSHRQISHRLTLPLGTVKSRIKLGVARMRTELGAGAERLAA